jgi:hypothetical protein
MMAMEGLRGLTDAHRGMRMRAAHDKKRGVPARENVSPMHAPGQTAGAPPEGQVPGSEDDFMGTPEFDRLLAELCAKKG